MEKKTICMYLTEESFTEIADAVLKVIGTDLHTDPEKTNRLIKARNEFMSWWNDR